MPTQTPLTDAINALTTYANTVTSASDTTLSDAVATLAAGYGGGGYVEPLYPVKFPLYAANGTTVIGSFYAYRRNDCTHVKLSFSTNYSTAAVFVNLNTGASGGSTNELINNKSLWFTIPSGKQTVLKYANVVNAGEIQFRCNIRKANASENVNGYDMTDGTYTNGYTITVTQTTAQNASCFYLAFSTGALSSASGKTLEFDVSFTVDGDLYF